MPRSITLRLGAFCLACLAAASTPAEESVTAKSPNETAKRTAALSQLLSGATLVGHFTVTGEKPALPATERYELGEVKPLNGENWSFPVRIRYGDHDVTVPLALPIRWAGDTPVVCVDGVGIPGLGVYTARVMFYRDHYAGFWEGADHGGHLFGVIQRSEKRGSEEAKPGAKSPSETE
jgi:hypothetical protein